MLKAGFVETTTDTIIAVFADHETAESAVKN
jgi:hypothetical protein